MGSLGGLPPETEGCPFRLQEVLDSIRSLAAGPTAAAHGAALEAASQRSSRRHHMLLLLEAWALRMHLTHVVGDDAEALEAVMRVNGIAFERQGASSMGAGFEWDATQPHSGKRRRKSKHRDSRGKHKKKRRESRRDSEAGSEDESGNLEGLDTFPAPVAWHLPGLQGGAAAAAIGFPEITVALTNHALEAWLRM